MLKVISKGLAFTEATMMDMTETEWAKLKPKVDRDGWFLGEWEGKYYVIMNGMPFILHIIQDPIKPRWKFLGKER